MTGIARPSRQLGGSADMGYMRTMDYPPLSLGCGVRFIPAPRHAVAWIAHGTWNVEEHDDGAETAGLALRRHFMGCQSPSWGYNRRRTIVCIFSLHCVTVTDRGLQQLLAVACLSSSARTSRCEVKFLYLAIFKLPANFHPFRRPRG